MTSEWDEQPLRELLEAPLRNGLTRPKRVRGSGTKMVNMGELFGHRRITSVAMDRVPIDDDHPERDLLKQLDLLFARQSIVAEGAGKPAIFLSDEEPVTFESHLIRARVDRKQADPRFVFAFFESPQGKARMRAIVNQTSAAGIRGRDLAELLVPCPPLVVQRRVAGVLTALDDKIEANQRLAETLEEVSAALFRARFVDYVGVEEFDESEIGPIPRGWAKGALGDLAEQSRELVDLDSAPAEEPYIGLDSMPRGSTVLSDWGRRSDVSGSTSRFRVGDVLLGKLRPYFKKVGVAPVDGSCSTEILVLRPRDERFYGVVLGHLSSQPFIDHCVAVSTGTRMPRAEWKAAAQFAIAIPPESVAAEYSDQVRKQHQLIASLIHESRTLAGLRDSLLPKLISGQIRVRDTYDPDEVLGPAIEGVAA